MFSTLPLHLARPEALLLLIPCVLLLIILWRRNTNTNAWHKVIDADLLPHLLDKKTQQRNRRTLPLLFAGLWLLGVVAISGPSWSKLPQPVFQNSDALVVVLDLSYSMMVKDIQPSRLVRAKDKVRQLLALRTEGQTALVAYAGDAHVVSPLTDDTKTITNLLPALSPVMMPVPGADAAAGFQQALQLLHSAGLKQGRILLISDEVSSRNADRIKTLLAENPEVALSTIGVGTRQGAPISLPNGSLLRDRQGEIVIPTFNSAVLKQLANAGDGQYHNIQFNDGDIIALSKPLPANTQDNHDSFTRKFDVWQDAGHWFLLPALLLMLLLFRRGALMVLLMPALLLSPSQKAQAGIWQDLWQTPNQQAAKALADGDAERAAKLFENPQWRAAANYDNGDFQSATEGFSLNDNADGWYNRGNALAKAGDLDAAIEAYDRSLALSPKREDAQANKSLVEALKRQQQEQQKQEQEQEQQDQNQDQQNQDEQNQQDSSSSDDASQNPQQQSDQQDSKDNSQQQDQSPQNASDQPPEQSQQQDDQQAQDDAEPHDAKHSADEQEKENEASQAQTRDEQSEQQNTSDKTASQMTPEELEQQQAMEQWLRRVPDDPAGLLQNKFRYESRLRQGQRKKETENDEKFW